MYFLQNYEENIDAQSHTMQVTGAPRWCQQKSRSSTCLETFLPPYSSKMVKANIKNFSTQTKPAIFLMTNRKDIAVVLYVSQHKGKASIILVNDSPTREVLYKENILGYAIPVQQEKFLTLKI